MQLSEAFAGCLDRYRQTLRFSSRAATAFYADPARGFRAMRMPFVRQVAGQNLHPWTECQEPGHAHRTCTVLTYTMPLAARLAGAAHLQI